MTAQAPSTNPPPEEPQAVEPAAPVVFQCSSCSQIVADSFSWVCSHRQLNSFTTAVATKGVVVSEELETSRTGVDLGSTTTAVSCSKCNTVLGRIYKTTPRWLDGIRYPRLPNPLSSKSGINLFRDMYTFNLDKIISYELGTDEPTTLAANKINLFTASADDILSRMGKLELLCVSLFERVGELEKILKRGG